MSSPTEQTKSQNPFTGYRALLRMGILLTRQQVKEPRGRHE